LTFDSTHFAIDGEKALARSGIQVRVMGRPVELGADCGFCLRVAEADLERALAALAVEGLACRGAFLRVSGEGGESRYRRIWPEG
jgi:bacterioferritin-associated ferredoxin